MGGLYIASKAKLAPEWRKLRDAGWPICSTWIDEAGEGQTRDWRGLARRCMQESSSADVLLFVKQDEENYYGALMELGSALSHRVPVVMVARNLEHYHLAAALVAAPALTTSLSCALGQCRSLLGLAGVPVRTSRRVEIQFSGGGPDEFVIIEED